MDLRKKQRVVLEALEDIKGRDIVVFNTARMPSMFERVVIASGDSTRQVKALADRVQEQVRENGVRGYGVEGEASGEGGPAPVMRGAGPAVRGSRASPPGTESACGRRCPRAPASSRSTSAARISPRRSSPPC